MKLNQLHQLRESSTAQTLVDAMFTNPAVFGADDLENFLDNEATSCIDDSELIDAVEEEEGQGTIGDNNSTRFDGSVKLTFDGKNVCFTMNVEDYYRDRNDDKSSSTYDVRCYCVMPLIDGKIDSVFLDNLEDGDSLEFEVGSP